MPTPRPPTFPARRAQRPAQRGQALTEFVMVLAVGTPLLIGVPLLAKYLDMMWATEQAARYVGFEGSVRNTSSTWKSDAQLATEVSERIFVDSTAPILSAGAPRGDALPRNMLWTDRNGADLMAAGEDAVVVRSQAQAHNPIAVTAFHQEGLGLPIDNFYSGSVTLKMANATGFAPFDALNLQTTRRFALLADPWAARGPEEVRERISGSWRTYPIDKIAPVVNFIGQAPRLVRDRAFVVGEHDWDNVPDDSKVGGR